jgi:hypothetical protein
MSSHAMRSNVPLSVVKEAPPPPTESEPDADLVLIGALFVLNLIPVTSELAGVGHWSPAIVGFAAAAAILTGRELWSQLRTRTWKRSGAPRPKR